VCWSASCLPLWHKLRVCDWLFSNWDLEISLSHLNQLLLRPEVLVCGSCRRDEPVPRAQKGDCGIGGAFLTVPNVALVIRACSLSDGETKIKNQTATRWPVRRPACLCSCLCCSYPHAERGLTGLRCRCRCPVRAMAWWVSWAELRLYERARGLSLRSASPRTNWKRQG